MQYNEFLSFLFTDSKDDEQEEKLKSCVPNILEGEL